MISFTTSQGDTLLYPDLIKADMNTAQAVGIIKPRTTGITLPAGGLLTPNLIQEEAGQRVGQRLNVQSKRQCPIPMNSGKRLYYEFYGE